MYVTLVIINLKHSKHTLTFKYISVSGYLRAIYLVRMIKIKYSPYKYVQILQMSKNDCLKGRN
jgi:hypothetical protein